MHSRSLRSHPADPDSTMEADVAGLLNRDELSSAWSITGIHHRSTNNTITIVVYRVLPTFRTAPRWETLANGASLPFQ
jgi:hypothetical protein